MNRQMIGRYIWLGLPGLIGLVGLTLFLKPEDWLRITCLFLMGPYLLGISKLYEAYAIRRTQRALLVLVPIALRAADKVIPTLLRDGGTPEDLKEAVRKELISMTTADWGEGRHANVFDEEDFESVTEKVVTEMRHGFDPFVLLERAGAIGAEASGDKVAKPTS